MKVGIYTAPVSAFSWELDFLKEKIGSTSIHTLLQIVLLMNLSIKPHENTPEQNKIKKEKN